MRTTKLSLGLILFLTAAAISSLTGQDPPQLGTIQGIVAREGTNDPIPDVRITVVARGSLAATGFTAQQVLQAVNRGAAVNPELVQMAQDATRGGPQGALAAAVPLTAVSDSAGRFTVTNVRAGEHYVRAQLQGYFGPPINEVSPPIASVNAVVTGQQTSQVRVSLVPGGTISGRVTDAAGKPLLNSPLVVLQTVYDAGTPMLQPINGRPTDDRGEFRISLLPPGEYYLAASPVPSSPNAGAEMPVTTMYPGVTDSTKAIPLVLKGGAELSGMNIQIRTAPAAKVSGRVVSTLPPGPAPGGRGGTRPSIATIALVPRDKTALPDTVGRGAAISANADTGAFEIPNLPPGSYDLFARLPVAVGWGALAPPERATAPWALGRATVEVGGANVEGVTITVRPGFDVKGHLTVDGKAAASAIRLSLIPDDSATRVNDGQDSQLYGQIAQYPVKIGEDGSFAFPVIPEGRYRFQAANLGSAYLADIRQGSSSVYDNGLTVGAEGTNPVEVLINSNGGNIQGTVLGADRKPVSDTTVVLVPPTARRQNPALYVTARTNAQGQFTMNNLAPGPYKLFAWESVRAGAYQNAEFLRKFEERGTAVTIAGGARVNADVVLIRN